MSDVLPSAARLGELLTRETHRVDRTLQMTVVVVICDYRKCKLCTHGDEEDDYVFPHQAMVWAYPPDPQTHRNRGGVCWYCMRVFESEYGCRGVKLAAFVVKHGSDRELQQSFEKLRNEVVTYCKQEGSSRGLKWNWEKLKSHIEQVRSTVVRTAAMPDRLVPLTEYILEHGDPALNGKGHRLEQLHGETIVCVPGKREWTRVREEADTVQHVIERADCRGCQPCTRAINTTTIISITIITATIHATTATIDTMTTATSSSTQPRAFVYTTIGRSLGGLGGIGWGLE